VGATRRAHWSTTSCQDRGHGSAGQTLGKKVMGSPVTTLDEEIAARVKVQEQEQHQQLV